MTRDAILADLGVRIYTRIEVRFYGQGQIQFFCHETLYRAILGVLNRGIGISDMALYQPIWDNISRYLLNLVLEGQNPDT